MTRIAGQRRHQRPAPEPADPRQRAALNTARDFIENHETQPRPDQVMQFAGVELTEAEAAAAIATAMGER